MERPIVREAVVERRQAHVRWGAVFAGAITAFAGWILLQLLGTGIGLSVLDTRDAANLRDVGIGTGVWSIVAPFIALFLGALTGARLAGTVNRAVGMLHGVVMWAMTSVVGMFLAIWAVGAIASGIVRVGTNAASAAVAAVSSTGSDVAQTLGLDTNDLLGPVNSYLRQQGKPEITADQATATVRGVTKRGIRGHQLDRSVLVDELVRNTSLSRADAEDLANRFGDRYQQAMVSAQQGVERLQDQAKAAALDAAHGTGRGMLWGGIAMLVALIAAAGGGALGVPRRRAVVVSDVPPPAV